MPTSEKVTPVLLEKVYQLIQDKLEVETQPLVSKLAEHLYSNISQDDLFQRNESDLYGAVVSLWQHILEKDADMVSVKVFNPTLSRQGWQSSHTVIEIVVPDSAFLVDSVKMAINRLGLTSHFMANAPTQISRKKDEVVAINDGQGDMQSLFHIEIDRLNDKARMSELKDELLSVLKDTRSVVEDWHKMSDKLLLAIKETEDNIKNIPLEKERLQEDLAFLRWLGEHNFTFMGYRI